MEQLLWSEKTHQEPKQLRMHYKDLWSHTVFKQLLSGEVRQ